VSCVSSGPYLTLTRTRNGPPTLHPSIHRINPPTHPLSIPQPPPIKSTPSPNQPINQPLNPPPPFKKANHPPIIHPPTKQHPTPDQHQPTCGSPRSFSCSRLIAPVANTCTALRSRAAFKSSDPRKSAHSSHFFLLKLKTTHGRSPSFFRRFTSPCHCVLDPAVLAHRPPPPPPPPGWMDGWMDGWIVFILYFILFVREKAKIVN
jgi:hypothetical protein